MSLSACRKHVTRAFAAIVFAALLAALAGPVSAFAMPPSPGLLERAKTDAALRLSIDKYVNGAKPAGLDQPSATLDVTALRSSWLSADLSSSSKLSAGIYDVTVGGFRQLVLLVDFSDKPAAVAPSFYDNLIFKDTVGPASVRGYYREVSAGALQILPVAADLPSARGWLRMPQPYTYYCPSGSKGQGTYPNNCQKMAEDALAAAEAAGVDFSNYDNNHDGNIDSVVIIHSGRGQELSGNAADIWSHKWNVRNTTTYDGVRTSGYTTEPEYWSTPGDLTTGVICHELGHTFGLPDLYDTDYSTQGIGHWSLMAGGSWNGLNGSSPSRPDAYCMTKLGFATATESASGSVAVTIRSANASSTGDIYRVEKAGATGGKQYFLIENRQRTGTDSGLPGSGLLIWHIDENVATNDNELHYRVDLEEAHGGTQNLSSTTKSNGGDAGDPFPGTSGKSTFSDVSDPNSTYYDGTGDVMVTNISANSPAMSALLVRDRLLSLDLTPPVTTSDARAAYDTSAVISLNATDSGSGVASTNWTLDGTAGTGRTVTVLAYGTHTLLYWSVDAAGNVEAATSATFSVRDITAPVATSDAQADYTGSASVRVTARDEAHGSGIVSISMRLDGQPTVLVRSSTATAACDTPGGHALAFSAVDTAGNRSATSTVVFTITAFVPVAPAASPDANEVTADSVVVAWAAVDHAAQYEYELNGTASEPFVALSANVSGLVDGANVVRVRAINSYGDAGPWSQPFTVDRIISLSGNATSTVTVSGSGSAILTVRVLDQQGAGMSGQQVVLQTSADRATWSDLATLTTDVNGMATYAYKTSTGTWVRSVVLGSTEGPDPASAAVKVLAVPGLAKPLTPRSVRHRRTFTISGYLKPRQTAGAHSVTIKFYRYRNGAWRYYKTVKTTNSNYSSYTKYSVRTTLPTAGSWRAYAHYSATADFVAATSGYTKFRVY